MELGTENRFHLRCTGLPAALLDKTAAKEHFSKFGRILSIHLRSKSKGCSVDYADQESLENALANAGKYAGKSFVVTRGLKATKKSTKKELWTPNPEVQQELEAMSGVGVYKLGSKLKEKKLSKVPWSTTQKKTSKASEQNPLVAPSMTTEQKELLKIIKQSAQTVDEKFRALEARDKLIRLRTQKQADLDAERTIGTCPDMCPEKERLMRETQHQVALYEQEPSTKTLNPCLAVKQYSRSSADQESPLPHELRPVNVLQMTMGYLMHKIIPLCDNPEVNLGEWYHFLWDRTRGIRKDITQQELCCHGSVELVEQCARFHIHCSARLVAEDTSVFDHKINTENLTKCLQTLKYMYHDLRCKNQSCKNEAEFRGYIILLNLNDGNFMWEVQQLRYDIQKSEQVQFALKVYSALDKNNYVKFFKLVKSTTYLNACILLRYFIQVRVRALQTILKSFSPRIVMQFPLEELKNILAFEGVASTRDFVEYYGLYMNASGNRVCLDRTTFSIPELPYTLDRAVSVVESKRILGIGEIICGGNLPPKIYETHQPHSSFDKFGFININEYFSDIDLNSIQIIEDEKPEDKSIFNLKKTDSRSNSPFDTVDSSDSKSVFGNKKSIFERLERSQDTIFGQKPQQENIFGKKPQQESIFGDVRVENQPVPPSESTQIGLRNQEIFTQTPFTQKSNIFASNKNVFASEQVSENKSIFTKNTESLPKPIPIFGQQNQQQQSSSSSIFQQQSQNKSSIFSQPTTFTNITQPTPIFHNQAGTSSNIFGAAKSSTGGFSFNLSPTKEKNLQQKKLEENRIFELQRKEEESIRQKLLEEKRQKEIKEKEEAEQKRFEQIEREKRLEQEKQRIAQEKILEQQALQKRIEEAKILEERLQREKEERERQRQKELRLQQQLELQRKIELEKQKQKEMQEIRRSVSLLVKNLLSQVEEKNKNDRLNEIKENIINRKMRCFVAKWRNNIASQKRKRKAIDDWPIWVSSITPEEEAKELMQNNQSVVLMDMKRYKTGCATNIDVRKKINLKKIDFHDIITLLLKGNLIRNHIFWKIDICLPTINESKNNLRKLEEYVNALFNFDDTTHSLVETKNLLGKTVTYYVKKYDRFYKDEATDGFVFINDVFTEEFYLNIKQTIESRKSPVLLPMVLVLSDPNYNEDKLDELIENCLISNYTVFHNDFNPENLESLLKNSLLFLAENIPEQPKIELDVFRAFLMKYLVSEMWERINSFAEHNRPYGMCLTRPEIVFYLYRKMLSRLEKMIFNEDLWNYEDFPKVFRGHLLEESPISLPCDRKYFPAFWKNESYNRKLHRVFDNLKFPRGINPKWPPKDIDELQEVIYDICQSFKCPEKSYFVIVSSIIQKLEQLGNFSDIKFMMWTDVMKMLTVEKLKTLDFTLREPFVSESVFDELFVVYDAKDLEKFNAEYWFYIDPLIQEKMDCTEIVLEESEDEIVEEDDFDLEETLKEVMTCDIERDELIAKGRSEMKELREMLSDLEKSMEIQKKISGKFQETLSLALSST